jgi:predicted methyltransferase
MGVMSVLSYAQALMRAHVQAGDAVIDATVGNGVDTLFLAQLVGAHGTVYGFDIQAAALARAAVRLQAHGLENVHLFASGHEHLAQFVAANERERIAGIMFNLGYLPGGEDVTLTTQPVTTLAALAAAVEWLRPGGMLTIVLYPGHDGGAQEAAAVEAWAGELSSYHFDVLLYRMLNRRTDPPYLIAVSKKKLKTRPDED